MTRRNMTHQISVPSFFSKKKKNGAYMHTIADGRGSRTIRASVRGECKLCCERAARHVYACTCVSIPCAIPDPRQ